MFIRLSKLTLLFSILSVLFLGCDNDGTTTSLENMSYQDRATLNIALKSGSTNRISYKLDSIKSIDRLSVKLPFQIIEPVLINFYDANKTQINLNNISFTEENWDQYFEVFFSKEILVDEIYYQLENQVDKSIFVKLVDNEFIQAQKELKSVEEQSISDITYNELLSMGYSSEDINSSIFSVPIKETNQYIFDIYFALNDKVSLNERKLQSNTCRGNYLTISRGRSIEVKDRFLFTSIKIKAYTNVKDACNNPYIADKLHAGISIRKGKFGPEILGKKTTNYNTSAVSSTRADDCINCSKPNYFEQVHKFESKGWTPVSVIKDGYF